MRRPGVTERKFKTGQLSYFHAGQLETICTIAEPAMRKHRGSYSISSRRKRFNSSGLR